jgi:hypothetical protein
VPFGALTSEKLKPAIRLKIKTGKIEFEIECGEDQLKEVLERVLLAIMEHVGESVVIAGRGLPFVRTETCKHVLQKLWLEGWFASPRGLGEVHNEMARRGYHYDRGRVAHALVDLVKDNLLIREGQPRSYHYVQKKQPSRASVV